jgi:hypothetical protein
MVLIVFIGVLSILGLLLFGPSLFRQRGGRGHEMTRAISNARQIGLALFEFEIEHGKFPDPLTVAAVQKATGSSLPLGTASSNDFFRQLVASGICQSESMFYAQIPGCRRPDNLIHASFALEKGECGFSYLAGLTSMGNPKRPIVVTPLIPGTDRFDPKPFDGKAIILNADNSVSSLPIEKDGRALFDGRHLLDPAHPVWAGEKWTLVWPE